MRLAVLTSGLPDLEAHTRAWPPCAGGVASVAVARGWGALDDLAATAADRQVLVVDGLDGAPARLDAPVALVATTHRLAVELPGQPYLVRDPRPAMAGEEPAPLTRGPLDDVVVRASTVPEVLAAFAAGRTVVADDTPAMREAVTHGHDGLLASGRRGRRDALSRLDGDRVLLHLLRHNAWRTARGWPDAAQQATVLAGVVRHVARGPRPDPPGVLPRPSLTRRLRRALGAG